MRFSGVMGRVFVLLMLAGIASCGKESPTGPSGIDLNGYWAGSGVDNVGGFYTIILTMAQDGNRVSGSAGWTPAGTASPFENIWEGTLSGTTLTMTFGWTVPGCSGFGTLTFRDVTSTSLNGSYTGGTTCSPVGNVGNVTLTKAAAR